MAKLISFPFRISAYGGAVSIEQGDDLYYNEQIATILMTHQGERILNESVGMPDTAYSGFNYSAFQSQVVTQMPEIIDLKANIETIDETTENVVVEFNITREY